MFTRRGEIWLACVFTVAALVSPVRADAAPAKEPQLLLLVAARALSGSSDAAGQAVAEVPVLVLEVWKQKGLAPFTHKLAAPHLKSFETLEKLSRDKKTLAALAATTGARAVVTIEVVVDDRDAAMVGSVFGGGVHGASASAIMAYLETKPTPRDFRLKATAQGLHSDPATAHQDAVSTVAERLANALRKELAATAP